MTTNQNQSNTQPMEDLLNGARAGRVARVLCLDTETTGLTDEDRITQFSAVMLTLSNKQDVNAFLHGKIASVTTERYDAFCNPCRPLTPGAAEVTGLSDSYLRQFPTFGEGIRHDAQRLVDEADIIVGHNVGFDVKRLRNEGIDFGGVLVVDTMFDFRDMCKYRWGIERPVKNLTAAAGFFGYVFEAHNSANDVDATLFLLSQLASADEVCSRSVDEIVKMHESHSRRAAAYRRRFQSEAAAGEETRAA